MPRTNESRRIRCLWLGTASTPPPALRDALEQLHCEAASTGELAIVQRRLAANEIELLLIEPSHPAAAVLFASGRPEGVAWVVAGEPVYNTDGETDPDCDFIAAEQSPASCRRTLDRALRRAKQERTLLMYGSQLERVHRFARIGSFEIDWNSQRVLCTPQACRIFGFDVAFGELPLAEFADLVGGTASDSWHVWWSTLASGSPQGAFEQRIKRADGTDRVVRVHAERVASPCGAIELHAIVHDITDRRRVEEELEYQANHDDLTGLANRRQLHEALARTLREAVPGEEWVAVFFLDLDRFKDVNESLGHSAGDQLLVEMAKRLRAAVRSGESMRRRGRTADAIARVGGDEFAVIVGDLGHPEGAAVIADRLREAFAQPLVLGGREIGLTTCVGYARVQAHAGEQGDASELIEQAETAMHTAKERGRSTCACFDPTMRHAADERMLLEAAMRRGLERGEFEVWYQPRVDLRNSRIVGFEALVRWRRPEHGLVPPLQFIGLAEECGFIVPLGAWVLREACRQAHEWRQAGFAGLRMAVNVSAVQFRDRALLETVFQSLTEVGLPADALEIELTESTIMDDVESALGTLKLLKDRGIHLAIDDFGTGYSSLAYLKRLPLDCLKIDRSFVQDITTDTDDAAIASLIVTMAHRLRLEVVAEGAETEEQVEFLRREGCDQVQGYYFGRPQPAAESTVLLERQLVQASV